MYIIRRLPPPRCLTPNTVQAISVGTTEERRGIRTPLELLPVPLCLIETKYKTLRGQETSSRVNYTEHI